MIKMEGKNILKIHKMTKNDLLCAKMVKKIFKKIIPPQYLTFKATFIL